MSQEKKCDNEDDTFMNQLKGKVMKMMKVEYLDHETTKMVERIVVLRIATKHINLWSRQLEMKRKEISELAGLMKNDDVKKEVEVEKNLEKWAKSCTNHFTKRVKRMLYTETDNMVWNDGGEIAQWCKRNKVYDEITESEIEEIWNKEDTDKDEYVRLNGKYVWETAKRVCDFVNSRENLIHITTFCEYRNVMKKVMMVIKEAHNIERKRRQSSRKKKNDDAKTRTQRVKALICIIKQGKMRKEDIERNVEVIFGKGSKEEIEKETSIEKIAERIEEMSKREAQIDGWERMRREAKNRQREDRRLNVFWRKNKCFPAQYGGTEDTPDAEETLMFWRSINNKDISEGWFEDESIQEVLREERAKLHTRGRCRWAEFTEAEFDEVLRCTAP